MDACPCDPTRSYDACCAALHHGGEPATALLLMRARYSAFARGETAFLVRTAHPLDRPRLSMRDLRASCALTWLGLEIIAHERGGADDATGMVHFRARFRNGDGVERVHDERSRFVRVAGCWVYRDARG